MTGLNEGRSQASERNLLERRHLFTGLQIACRSGRRQGPAVNALQFSGLRKLAQIAPDRIFGGTEFGGEFLRDNLAVFCQPGKDQSFPLRGQHRWHLRPFSEHPMIARSCTIIHDIAMHIHSFEAAKPWLVLIAGPYLSGTQGNPEKIAANRARLESFALPIFERGHIPVVGEWLALPIIQAAGGRSPGDDIFEKYQYPVAHRLIARCDAILRITGESRGADLDVARARELGLPVFRAPGELPLIGEGGERCRKEGGERCRK